MNETLKNAYADKINAVCDFISEHLNEDLSVAKLSQISNFSKFHFHRQFSEFTGITVAKYILMMRLKRASYQLVFKKEYQIIDIALDAHFENPESFSRAFKSNFNLTPSQFRKNPEWKLWNEHFTLPTIKRNFDLNIDIIDFPETPVAVLEHRDSPLLLNDSISEFIAWRKQSKLSPIATSNTYGVAYDDPDNTEPKDFRFDLCGSTQENIPKNDQGVISKVIPGGRCALIRHLGSHEAMTAKIHFLYCEWLPASGEELRDFPCFFHYLNLFPEVQEHELITDIYLPLI